MVLFSYKKKKATYVYKVVPSLEIAGTGKQKKALLPSFLHRRTIVWPVLIYLTVLPIQDYLLLFTFIGRNVILVY